MIAQLVNTPGDPGRTIPQPGDDMLPGGSKLLRLLTDAEFALTHGSLPTGLAIVRAAKEQCGGGAP